MTHDPHDSSVNRPMTRDLWRSTTHHTSHCHSVTFAYREGKEVSMWFRFHTVPTPSPRSTI